MITKAIVQSINATGTRCIIRMPLFETASSSTPVIAEALVNIMPGVFNNIEIDDVVFVGFEENAIEKPIIIGKLFKGAQTESEIRGGGGIFDTIKVNTTATLPATTTYSFPVSAGNAYQNLQSPKDQADYVKWLESLTKNNLNIVEANFNYLRDWSQWKTMPENVEIDDGDLDTPIESTQAPSASYIGLSIDKKFPSI